MHTTDTLGRSETGLAFRRRVKALGKEEETPGAVIDQSKAYFSDEITDDARGLNELFKEVNTGSLHQARESGFPLHIKSLDDQNRRTNDDEFNFCFLSFKDAHEYTRLEAYQMEGIVNRVSDFLPVPIHSNLDRAINPDNGLDDPAYQANYSSKELFLQACVENDPHKPIMGGIPPLDLEYIEDLMNLYENYGVEAFYFDFDWNLPTGWDKVARVGNLVRRVANQRMHEDVLFYGINARQGTMDDELGYMPAADRAMTYMGIDIIGGNHKGPRLPPELYEELDERDGFRLFDAEVSGYWSLEIGELPYYWPEGTGLDVTRVMEKARASNLARNRYESLVNGILIERDLSAYREALETNREKEYFDSRKIVDSLLDPGGTVQNAFNDGLQADLGQFS